MSSKDKAGSSDMAKPEHGDVSNGEMAISEHTIFERKMALVNAEIDKLGFGKYQMCIWMLCGMGYFIDLGLVQGVALMATAVFQEMNVPSEKQGLIYTCSNAGLAVGAFGFGIITDIIGRKWAFQLTCLITAVFAMLMAASQYNYGAICGIYFLSCVGLGGNIPIDATIALEFLPKNRRYLVALLNMWQPIGVVIACAIAYGTVAKYRCGVDLPACIAVAEGEPCCTMSSNMGWRYLVIIIGAMALAIFSARYLLFSFYESPKFLISQGRDQTAIDVLHKIAKFNKAEAPALTVEDLRQVETATGFREQQQQQTGDARSPTDIVTNMIRRLGFLRGLFLSKLQLFSFILLSLAYMGIYLPGVLGAVAALFSIQVPLFGRKWSLVISAALQGLSMAMYTQVESTAGYVGLNALEYIMQSYFNAVLYSAAPEMFDTTYRASASGLLSCFGRIAGIVAPFAGQKYISEGAAGVLWLGAGGIWLAAFLLCFLPIEMRNKQMN